MKARIRESWMNLTHPAQHHPQQFVYLVTGLTDTQGRSSAIERYKRNGTYDPAQDIDLYSSPKKIHQIKRIYASVVTPAHPFVFVRNGLILRCPPENIIDMQIEDSFGHVRKDPSTYHVSFTVEELVKATKPAHFNEVTLTGTTQHGRVEVVGLFTAPDYRKDNRFTQEQAERLGLRLITHPWRIGAVPGLTDILNGRMPEELTRAMQAEKLSIEQDKLGDLPFVTIDFNPSKLKESKKSTPAPQPSSSEKKSPKDSYCGLQGGFLNPKPKTAPAPQPAPSSPATTKQDDSWCKRGFLL